MKLNKIHKKRLELYKKAQDAFCNKNYFSVYENLKEEEATNYEFLSWFLGETQSSVIYEEIFKDVRDDLGFGYNDDLNYYGDNKERYGEPLTKEEEIKLYEEVEKRVKDKLKEIIK